ALEPLGGAAEPAHRLTPRWYKRRVNHRGLLLLCAVALTALIAPSSAHAASFNCEASALRLSLAGTAPQEPSPPPPAAPRPARRRSPAARSPPPRPPPRAARFSPAPACPAPTRS